MGKRVYKEYIIKITEETGSRVVRINKNVDMTNYTIARETYNKTKDIYIGKNEDIKIEFIGVNLDGTIGNIIYTKQFLREIQETDKELLTPTDEVVAEIKSLMTLLARKKVYHADILGAYNKKQDSILHSIEALEYSGLKGKELIDEKLKLINELEAVRRERRFNKTETGKLSSLDTMININETADKFFNIEIPIEHNIEYRRMEDLSALNIIKEVKYANTKDRQAKMEQLNGKYNKIVDDAARNKLICYNYGYSKR